MATVTAPLLSMTAAKTFGKTITYYRRNGQNIARQRVVPENPRSPAQTVQRDLFSAMTKYRNIYIACQDGYNHFAKSQNRGLSGPAYLQGQNLRNIAVLREIDVQLAGAFPGFLFWDGVNTTEIGLFRIDTRNTWASSTFSASLQCIDANGNTIATFYVNNEVAALEGDVTGTNAVSWAHGALPDGTSALKYIITVIHDGETQPYDYVISGLMAVFD